VPWQSVAKLVLLNSHSKAELLWVVAQEVVAVMLADWVEVTVVLAQWVKVTVQSVQLANWVVVAVVPLVHCALWRCGSVSLNVVGSWRLQYCPNKYWCGACHHIAHTWQRI